MGRLLVRPYWTEQAPRKRDDLVRLRPPALPKGKRFETARDADVVVGLTLRRLGKIGERWATKAAMRVADCTEVSECGNPICAGCARAYRRWFCGEVLRTIRTDRRSACIITILLKVVDGGDVGNLSLPPHKDLLRKKIRRSGMSDVVALGGFEVGYKPPLGFVLHAHLCLIGATEAQITSLRESFADTGIDDAFELQQLRNPSKQVSYLLKIASYFRPRRQTGPRKSRAAPLPDQQFAVWARWVSGVRFEELLFLHGLRRRGVRISRSDRG